MSDKPCQMVNEQIWGNALTPDAVEHLDVCTNCAEAFREASHILPHLSVSYPLAPDCRGIVRRKIITSRRKGVVLRLGTITAIAAFIAIGITQINPQQHDAAHEERTSPDKPVVVAPPQPQNKGEKNETTMQPAVAKDLRHANLKNRTAKAPSIARKSVVAVQENKASAADQIEVIELANTAPPPADPVVGAVVYSSGVTDASNFEYTIDEGDTTYRFTGSRKGDSIALEVKPVLDQTHPKGDSNENNSPDA